MNFITLFETLVDQDDSILVIDKFNHLISCLSGEALGIINSYQFNESNYEKALVSLKKMHDNE